MRYRIWIAEYNQNKKHLKNKGYHFQMMATTLTQAKQKYETLIDEFQERTQQYVHQINPCDFPKAKYLKQGRPYKIGFVRYEKQYLPIYIQYTDI